MSGRGTRGLPAGAGPRHPAGPAARHRRALAAVSARALVGIAVLGAALGVPARAAGLEPVRIVVGERLRHVEIGAPDAVTVVDPAGGRPLFGLPGPRVVRVALAESGLEIGNGRTVALGAVRLEVRRGPIRMGARDYPGAMEVWRQPEGLLVVNELPLEEYVGGTVRAEVSERWPVQALRAVAVVARTYAVYQQARNAGKPYHLVAGNQDQNFVGRVAQGSPAREAARATAGQVLTWRGRVFPTFYHSDSGGYTEFAQNVFSGDGVPPLAGVRDQFSLESPNYTWRLDLPLAAIGERLRRGGVDVGQVTRLVVLERSRSLRVARIAVEHSRGTATLRGPEFRRLIGYDVLKSTLFVALPQDGAVRFEGRGWGHGVGLSQFGAKGMADRGYTYAEILAHYYPGTALITLR